MAPGDLHDQLQPPAQGIGHLFSGRYKALMVEGSGNDYLKAEFGAGTGGFKFRVQASPKPF